MQLVKLGYGRIGKHHSCTQTGCLVSQTPVMGRFRMLFVSSVAGQPPAGEGEWWWQDEEPAKD
jgi:hypothetical protein